jgi:hypothetical protein
MPLTGLSFLAHQGRQAQPLLRGFFDDVQRVEPSWRTGFATGLTRYVPTTCEAVLSNADSRVVYALADPETHVMLEPFAERGRARSHLAYLQESDPRANRDRFVANVLQAQVDAGRRILISPWLTHGVTGSSRNLRATIRFAELADGHPLIQGHDLWFGIAATEEVFADGTDRDDLLDDLVDLPNRPFYVRMRVTPPTSFTQYANEDALRGLRAFVEALAANGRPVFLPQMGLAGWLMLPFGAYAFGAGVSASLQRFVAPTGGFGQPLDWYFLPEFLGFVLRHEVPILLSRLGLSLCDCPYCGSLDFGRGAWDSDLAGLHYLWTCIRLTARIAAAPDGRIEARRLVADAEAEWAGARAANVLLDPRSQPGHLAVWSAVLA